MKVRSVSRLLGRQGQRKLDDHLASSGKHVPVHDAQEAQVRYMEDSPQTESDVPAS